MLTVLMGTVYPLLIEGLGLGKLSVGAPYFNAVFIPLMVPMLLIMGVGIHLKWNKDTGRTVFKKLNKIVLFSLIFPMILLSLTAPEMNYSALMGLILATWVTVSTLIAAYQKIKERGLGNVSQAYWGMLFAHCGVAVSVIGVAISTAYGIQDDVQMSPGKSINLSGYNIEFVNQSPLNGPNYKGTTTEFKITHAGHSKIIHPEKRLYTVGQMPMTESAIDVTPFRDIYVALGEPISADSWSVRVYYKPFVRWIWAGGFIILAGGFLALTDRRYYRKKQESALAVQELRV